MAFCTSRSLKGLIIMNVPRRYGLLRLIAFLLKFIAWVILVIGLLGAVGLGLLSARAGNQTGILAALPLAGTVALPILGIVWWVQFFAFGSILSLLIDIEENTRLIAAKTPDALPEA
jgi:hypothetical protein